MSVKDRKKKIMVEKERDRKWSNQKQNHRHTHRQTDGRKREGI